MFLKRMFPNRWARILTWTGAALAWGSTTIGLAMANDPSTNQPDNPTADTLDQATTTTTIPEALPTAPANGLVVIRYTPVPAPAPQVITRTVTVQGGSTAAASGPVKTKSRGS